MMERGSGCFKCGQEGHLSRDCPEGDKRGSKGCVNCGEDGHMSRDCPNKNSYDNKRRKGSLNCGEDGHMSRDCPNKNSDDNKLGKGCLNCGEDGHMSRDCPNPDKRLGPDDPESPSNLSKLMEAATAAGKPIIIKSDKSSEGDEYFAILPSRKEKNFISFCTQFPSEQEDEERGSGCFKCGQEGHLSRDCQEGDKRGSKGCFNCGEDGHMSRDCPNKNSDDNKRGRGCFNCGEDGNMSRDCPNKNSDDNKLGKGCLNCGEDGHMSRDCPNPDKRLGPDEVNSPGESPEHMNIQSLGASLIAKITDSSKWITQAKSPEHTAKQHIQSLGASLIAKITDSGKWITQAEKRLKSATWDASSRSAAYYPYIESCYESYSGTSRVPLSHTQYETQAFSQRHPVDLRHCSYCRELKRGSGCFKCGQEGHLSRDCPEGDKHGSRGCFNCGEDGHMSRDCPNKNSDDNKCGEGCFNCGEDGHMSRDCPNKNSDDKKRGKGCFNCGEDGHMSRDCPNKNSDDKKRGKDCFNCGEDGHMSRDCPNPSKSQRGKGCCPNPDKRLGPDDDKKASLPEQDSAKRQLHSYAAGSRNENEESSELVNDSVHQPHLESDAKQLETRYHRHSKGKFHPC